MPLAMNQRSFVRSCSLYGRWVQKVHSRCCMAQHHKTRVMCLEAYLLCMEVRQSVNLQYYKTRKKLMLTNVYTFACKYIFIFYAILLSCTYNFFIKIINFIGLINTCGSVYIIPLHCMHHTNKHTNKTSKTKNFLYRKLLIKQVQYISQQ